MTIATGNQMRDAFFSAALRDKNTDYHAQGFTLNEHEDGFELRQYGQLVDRFTAYAGMDAIRASCKCWLIKNGNFGTLGITIEAQS